MMRRTLLATLSGVALTACGGPSARPDVQPNHLSQGNQSNAPASGIPDPVFHTLALLPPLPAARSDTFSVQVLDIPVRELLFALARDARVNIDIHPGIEGRITLNARDQTLPQLLNRIARQADVRFETDGPNLAAMPDTPFLRHYPVDYVNVSRQVVGTVAASTQIATGASSVVPAGTPPVAASGGNISSTRIENSSHNRFWEALEKNIRDILRETDKILPEGSSETVLEQSASTNATGGAALPAIHVGKSAGNAGSAAVAQAANAAATSQSSGNAVIRRNTFREAASVIVNPEGGIVTVRATQRQHEKIREFIDRVALVARRQVMIEATIVEVQLADGHEQGIDWSRLIGAGRFSLSSAELNGNIAAPATPFRATYSGKTVDAAIRLLESFGTARVLSSPRLSVLNHQTALLKVVENVVFFNVRADTTTTANVGQSTVVTTTPQSVSVGLVMAVTPQIGNDGSVTLNIRPTVSSIAAFKPDPNPNIPPNLENLVPQIRTREIESVMRIGDGDIAVLGGLMEDGIDQKTGRVPLLGRIPWLGEMFTARSGNARKSELLIFLRPMVIRDAALAGDFSPLANALPRPDFFHTDNIGGGGR